MREVKYSPMMDSSGTKSTLNDFESTSPAGNDVGFRNADVLVDYLVMSFGSIIEAELCRKDRKTLDQYVG